MTLQAFTEIGDCHGKTALLRVDFNVPLENGRIADATRIAAALPTITALQRTGARIVLLSHFGRPKGQRMEALSLRPIATALTSMLGQPVTFIPSPPGLDAGAQIAALPPGSIALLENLRFHRGEEANDPAFAKALADLGDLYINDAFSVSHRAHASITGMLDYLPSYQGLALAHERQSLNRHLARPQRPCVGIIGGAKVATKLPLIRTLIGTLDSLALGGAMANTFLAASGYAIGTSLHEPSLVAAAKEILQSAASSGCAIILPTDVVVAIRLERDAAHRTAAIGDIRPDEMILDCGPQTMAQLSALLATAKTVIWNGALGAFEYPPFDRGTAALIATISLHTHAGALTSIAGGGDTIRAIGENDAAHGFSFISSGGGAFLAWLQAHSLQQAY